MCCVGPIIISESLTNVAILSSFLPMKTEILMKRDSSHVHAVFT
jgi:hypothetical protein